MQPTMTAADWLRRAADAWEQAEAIVDPRARAVRLTIAEGYQRLAKHAALLANSPNPYGKLAQRPTSRWLLRLSPMKRYARPLRLVPRA
jgi:hypothetical protein